MNYLRKKFYEYYLKAEIEAPYRIERREFAFLFFNESTMKRHISFKNKEWLLRYLKTSIPAHVYYSSAYYNNPSAGTMREKKWMGADLIFDLDADHLPNANKLSYEESLERIKEELKKLLSFLIDDFGFDEKSISIYFSGGRGYHCHVHDKKILNLGNQERREIVDYIMARGLDYSHVIVERSIYSKTYTKTIEITPSSPGWRGRIARGIISFLEEVKSMEREEAIQLLKSFDGIGDTIAQDIYDGLDDRRMELIREGKIDQMAAIKRLLKPLIKELAVKLHSSTDEPVTADIKRLIRLPGSLHGKTGFRVTRVNLNNLEDFNPLEEAVVFGEEMVKIDVKKPFKIKLKGNDFALKEGVVKVPEYVAVFALARNMANIF